MLIVLQYLSPLLRSLPPTQVQNLYLTQLTGLVLIALALKREKLEKSIFCFCYCCQMILLLKMGTMSAIPCDSWLQWKHESQSGRDSHPNLVHTSFQMKCTWRVQAEKLSDSFCLSLFKHAMSLASPLDNNSGRS